jgi:hypothetical protein
VSAQRKEFEDAGASTLQPPPPPQLPAHGATPSWPPAQLRDPPNNAENAARFGFGGPVVRTGSKNSLQFPDELCDIAESLSGGNPLLLRTLASYWKESGMVVAQGNVLVVRGDLRDAVKAPSVQSVVQMLVDNVTGWGCVLMRAAVLLPQPFNLVDVQRLADATVMTKHHTHLSKRREADVIAHIEAEQLRPETLASALFLVKAGLWQVGERGEGGCCVCVRTAECWVLSTRLAR